MRRLTLLAAVFVLAGCGDARGTAPAAPDCKCTRPNFTELELLAGQPGGPGWVDGVGAAAHFSDPFALSGDGTELFLADGSTIRALDLVTRAVTTLAGSFGAVGGDDGVGPQATFYQPSGIVTAGGTLYLTDTENHTIRRLDLATREVTTIAGAYGVNGATDAIGVEARFREPEGLVWSADDRDGVLYISDTDNNSIRRMDLSTGEVSTVAGTPGAVGNVDDAGDSARFNAPKSIVMDDAGDLFVIDSGNMSVRKVTLPDGVVSTLATFTAAPTGMDRDGADLLVALGDLRIVRLTPETGVIVTIAGTADQTGFVDGTGADARFSRRPSGLWNDGAGTLYVADEGNYAVRAVTLATGDVTTFAGAISAGSADGTGSDARFSGPQGIAVGEKEIAYVADTANHTIRRVVLATGEVTTPAGVAGQTGLADGVAGDARFDQPTSVALDGAAQRLYVADAGNHVIRAIDLESGTVSTLPHAPAPGGGFVDFDYPAGLALSGARLFITDSGTHTVLSLDTKTNQVTVLAGSSTPGGADGRGSQAQFYAPTGIVADGHGNLFVADVMNDAIRQVVVSTGQVTTLAGAFDIQGTTDGVGRAARFAYPSALALSPTGDLFVADANNDTVRRIELATATVTTLIGSPKLSGVRPGALPAQLTAPSALAVTPDGRLAVFSENALLVAH